VTLVDWIALAIVLLAAFTGMRRGLILSAFSLAGLALGAFVGARVAPYLLSGGAGSLWRPVAGLVGAVIGAGVLQVAAVFAGSHLRGGLRLRSLRVVDSSGGFLLGIVTGLAIVWVCAAVVLHVHRHTVLRRDVQRSWIVRKLDAALPPKTLFHILSVIDPQQSFTGPSAPTLPPSRGILRNPRIHASLTRVVKVLGTACGAGIEGSGWFARGDLVVTAAHVVAGEPSTQVEIPGDPGQYPATVVVFDVHNDIAVLRISGASARPLRLVDPHEGASVAIAGYPLDGSLTAVPGRVGGTANFRTNDALGNEVERAITAVGGRVQHGDSGGPVIDTRGDVEGTIFAANKPPKGQAAKSGYAVPAFIIRSDLASAGRRAVSTESCAAP
jgi:S1-C subfamily serine protease